MKRAYIGLLVAFAVLILFLFTSKIHITQGRIDIQFHDTYFVLNHVSILIFIILFLGTWFSIGGIIGTHFKRSLFWVLLLVFVSVDIYLILPFFNP